MDKITLLGLPLIHLTPRMQRGIICWRGVGKPPRCFQGARVVSEGLWAINGSVGNDQWQHKMDFPLIIKPFSELTKGKENTIW